MDSVRPSSQEKSQLVDTPILVIDKKGILGEALIKKLSIAFLTIFVSNHEILDKVNVVYIPFKKTIPQIPNNTFSHIVVVYSGEKTVHTMLPSIIKKAKEDNATLIFITHTRFAATRFIEELHKRYERLNIIIYADVFGKKAYEKSIVTSLLSSAVLYGKLVLPNDGLSPLYPIYFDDLIKEILEVFFATTTKGRIYAAFAKQKITALAFAGFLQKIYPNLSIDFKKEKIKEESFSLPDDTQYLLGERYPFGERLKDYKLEKKGASSLSLLVPDGEEKGRRLPVGKSILLLFIVCVLAIVVPVGSAFFGFAMLFATEHAIEAGKLASAEHYIGFSKYAFVISEKSSVPLQKIATVVGQKKGVRFIASYIATGQDATAAVEMLLEGGILIEKSIGSNSSQAKSTFIKGLLYVSDARVVLTRLLANEHIPEREKQKITLLLKATTLVDAASEVLPDMLGFLKEKSYLVLLQNNFELRPGGGFIGSYAIAKIKNGVLSDMKIHNVYDADGQLQESIEPPFPLRRYVGIKHWYLRDSNFDPDFPTNAVQAANFLRKETGEKVDGVIGVDAYFLKELLILFGNIKVPDYNVIVTEGNFFRLLEEKAENEFFPGSTQKQDFLRAVSGAFFRTVSQKKHIPYLSLMQTGLKSMFEKHFLIVLADAKAQNVLTVNNLSGSLYDSRKDKADTFNDFLAISEANIGLNKSNYYVKRSIDEQVQIGADGIITDSILLTYKNSSMPRSIFGGEYRAYVRFVLPKFAEITSITIDGGEQEVFSAVTDPRQYESKFFKNPSGVEVERTGKNGKIVYGFPITIPIQSKKDVRVTYVMDKAFDTTAQSFAYDLLIRKQPGTGSDPFSLTISYPQDYKNIISFGVSEMDTGAFLNTQLKEDISLRLIIGKK